MENLLMAETKIEWADYSFNAVVGCTKVSPACDHCYAESWAKRAGKPELWHGELRRTSVDNWKQPVKWSLKAAWENVRPRVFCCSLSDVFDNQWDPQWRADLWDLIARCNNMDWILLTKRPQNIAKMLPPNDPMRYPTWPWRHVWLGTTAENQEEANRRIPHLLAVPAVVHFISCEPLLGPIDLSPWMLDNPVYENQGKREVCLSSSSERGLGNPRGRDDLEGVQQDVGHGREESRKHSMQAASRGTQPRKVSSGQDYVGRREGLCLGAQTGLLASQGANPERENNQPRERAQEAESPRQLGTGDALGADSTRAPYSESWPDRPKRDEERYGETNATTSEEDNIPQEEGRAVGGDSQRLRHHISSSIENRSRRSVGKISWVIAGGESGGHARMMEPAWARSLRDQCAEQDIAFFQKQMTKKAPIPADLLVRQYPEVFHL